MEKALIWAWLAVIGTCQVFPQPPAQSPLDSVRLSNERVRAILAEHDALDPRTEEALFAVVNDATDFALISRRATEAFRGRMSDPEYAEFNRTFQDLLRKSSLRKLGRYRADRFEYAGEEVRGDQALVRTRAFYEKEIVRLDYQMERVSGRWVIVNYVVDDVDTIKNYRKQFVRLFAANDAAGVIRRLNAKIAEIDEERRTMKEPAAGRR
jgi:ABC-type transporter MlaC component